MTSVKDSHKVQVAHRLEASFFFTIYSVRLKLLIRKGHLLRPLNCIGDPLVSDPITHIIRVTSHDENLNAVLDNTREFWQE
jgi:hypothetical protein